jgi:hypothetical protein
LKGKNTLAYQENSKIKDVKSFITFGPGHAPGVQLSHPDPEFLSGGK